jgi:hypothetical protein
LGRERFGLRRIWAQVTNFQPLERFLLRRVVSERWWKDFGQMEVKIVILLALIAAIAAAAHVGARGQSQERAN